MPKGMQAIYTQTITGTTNGCTFINIPQTFTDLKLVASVRTAEASAMSNFRFKVNYSTTSDYTSRYMSGVGSGAASFGSQSDDVMWITSAPGANATANTFGNTEVYIPNYKSGDWKSVIINSVATTTATTSNQDIRAGLIKQTGPITMVQFISAAGANFAVGSTFSIYGIGV